MLLVVGGYLNELSLLVVAAHAVTVLLARYGRRVIMDWAAVAALSVIVVLPLAALSARQDAAVAWIPRPGLTSLPILFHDYFGATTALAVLLLCCAVAAVLPPLHRGGRASGPAWWSQGGVSLPSVAAPLLVVPGALLILESLVARPLYVDRYVLYGEAGAALLAGAGAVRIGRWLAGVTDRRMLLWVPGVVVCVLALVLQLAPQQRVRTPQSRLFDFGGPSRYLAAHARPGDGVLFFSNFFRKARLGYPADYRERQRLRDGAVARRGRKLPGPGQAGRYRPVPDDRLPADLGGGPVPVRAPHGRAGPRRGRGAHQPLLPRREAVFQGHPRHALGAPLTIPARWGRGRPGSMACRMRMSSR